MVVSFPLDFSAVPIGFKSSEIDEVLVIDDVLVCDGCRVAFCKILDAWCIPDHIRCRFLCFWW